MTLGSKPISGGEMKEGAGKNNQSIKSSKCLLTYFSYFSQLENNPQISYVEEVDRHQVGINN